MMNLSEKSTIDLVNLYGNILSELNSRGVVRTYNSPVGDYAEWLVSHKLGLNLERNSQKGYDTCLEQDKVRITYQIKSRWEHGAPSAKTRKLSVLRDVGENAFHYLIAVIFGPHFEVPWKSLANIYPTAAMLTATCSRLQGPFCGILPF